MEAKIINSAESDRFAAYNGIKIEKAMPGYAVTKMEVTEHHLNGVNIIHGGAIFTLADYAFAAAANTSGNITVGINASISYLHAATGKMLTAEAKEISGSNKITTYNVDVFDENHVLVARLNITGYKKSK